MIKKALPCGGSNSADLVNPLLKNNSICLSFVYILLKILLAFEGRICDNVHTD